MKKNSTPQQLDEVVFSLHPHKLHAAMVNRISWSPNGNLLACPSDDGKIVIWGWKTGKIYQTLTSGNKYSVVNAVWSPNGKLLASETLEFEKYSINIWNPNTGELLKTLEGHSEWIWGLTWAPDGNFLASGSGDRSIKIWDANSWTEQKTLKAHTDQVICISWSPDGQYLASGSKDNTILLWDVNSGKVKDNLIGHAGGINSIAWSLDSRTLASGANDKTIRLWDSFTKRQIGILEGHTETISCISFSHDNMLLASKANDDSIRIWDWKRMLPLGIIQESSTSLLHPSLAFHPKEAILSTYDKVENDVKIFHIDSEKILNRANPYRSIYYTNAKVVLVGDSGTGKTCVARALMSAPFEPQESTHGLNVWSFKIDANAQHEGKRLIRETYLWDLAGQSDYKIIHQLFLDQTALVIILFDPTHPDNPFGSVGYWEKSIRKLVGDECPIILVAGRADRGYPAVIQEDINLFCKEHSFVAYHATSAKTGHGIDNLRAEIAKATPWDRLPITNSPEIWVKLRDYIATLRMGEEILTTASNLFYSFNQKFSNSNFGEKEFNTVLTHAQIQGLIWRFSFGDFVLLKPELMNDYASAIIRAARKNPDGLGIVDETKLLSGEIDFEDLPRIKNPDTERALLHAVVELLLAKEVAIRETGQFVFPSRFNRKRPDFPTLPKRDVVYYFSGPSENIYATLIVRLHYSGVFKLKNLWKNGAEFIDTTEKLCGIIYENLNDETSALSLFFDDDTSQKEKAGSVQEAKKKITQEAKILFIQFVYEHLFKKAVINTLRRERIYYCPNCEEEVKDKKAVISRLEKGLNAIPCLYCDERIPLIDLVEEKYGDQEVVRKVQLLEKGVLAERGKEIGITTTKAKEEIGEFDVFLAHNSVDKEAVLKIATKLRQNGINPWIDKEQIAPGRWFQDVIQEAIPRVKSAAIFIGTKDIGKWQVLELRAFISECVERNVPVIPVLLPDVDKLPKSLIFLKELSWVKFNFDINDTKALSDLIWGITGKRPELN